MKYKRLISGFVTVGTLVLLIFSLPFAASFIMRIQAEPNLYQSVASIPSTETVLVLGAAAYPSRLSDILKDRMDAAIDLYQAGKIKKLVLSGAPNEAEKMAEYALENGLKAENIEKDPQGLNTLASLQNASKKNKDLIIVSQSFHLPRALFIAQHLGIRAMGLAADRHDYEKIFDFKKRELMASTKAIMDLLLMGY